MKKNSGLEWAELWFDLWREQMEQEWTDLAGRSERQMWLALLFWAGMPCGQ